MDSVQRPDAYLRRYILEAAGRDPRYLPLLPEFFTVPDNNPYASIAGNFYALYDAEAKYPSDLRYLFNPCLQLNPREITPFLPYVIRGDLVSLLDKDNTSSTLEGVAGELDPLGNVGHSAVTDPAPASNGGDYSPTSAPAMDPQSGSLSCYDVTFDMNWDFKTMTARDAVVASIRIMSWSARATGVEPSANDRLEPHDLPKDIYLRHMRRLDL
ncbi:hypothetical protein BJ322DRAFT_1019257 [Thelephora terrestris]|uniref:Uncharacterized protein n=1 Tax=Thelephora terrestris TaxID=56493 RepID=A0A9P6HH02_9AGAM|nr:hypothetical protein BJ322DRAFT_1019257 [Thelephora terrestris]